MSSNCIWRVLWRHVSGSVGKSLNEVNVDDVKCIRADEERALAGDRRCAEGDAEGGPEQCEGAHLGVLGREWLVTKGGKSTCLWTCRAEGPLLQIWGCADFRGS